jgi:hypothetical protein
MSDLSRHRRYFLWLGVVGAAALAFALLLIPSGTWIALDQRRSSLRTTADGVAAWSRSLDQLGPRVAPRYGSLTDEPPRGAGLVILEPVLPPTAAEVRDVLRWVRQGGVLVYSPGFGGLVMDSLGLSLERQTSGPGLFLEPAERESLLPSPWTDGVAERPTASGWSVEADSTRALTWVPLSFVDDSIDVTLAWLPEGLGGVLVLADAEELANQTVGSSSLAIVVTRAIVDLLAPADTLFFSEYHQGLDGRRGFLREAYGLAASSPLGRVALYLAGAGVLLFLLSGRRFGSPLQEPEADRRSPLEHVEALGQIYRTSRSHGRVARRLVRGAARRMALQSYGAEPEAEILRGWASKPELAAHARTALEALEADPPDLVALSTSLDAIVTQPTSRVLRP